MSDLLDELPSEATDDDAASAELVSDAASEEEETASSAAELVVSVSELAPAALAEESGSGVSASGA